jgi:hypothetical protein
MSQELAPRQLEGHNPRQPLRLIRMRQWLLTLPVMVAIKVLAREGLLWVGSLWVSPQALTKGLEVWPAAVMGQLFAEVCARLQAQAPPPVPHPRWAPLATGAYQRAKVAPPTRYPHVGQHLLSNASPAATAMVAMMRTMYVFMAPYLLPRRDMVPGGGASNAA